MAVVVDLGPLRVSQPTSVSRWFRAAATGWRPDPSWPPPPYGWPLWLDDSSYSGRIESPGIDPQRQAAELSAGQQVVLPEVPQRNELGNVSAEGYGVTVSISGSMLTASATNVASRGALGAKERSIDVRSPATSDLDGRRRAEERMDCPGHRPGQDGVALPQEAAVADAGHLRRDRRDGPTTSNRPSREKPCRCAVRPRQDICRGVAFRPGGRRQGIGRDDHGGSHIRRGHTRRSDSIHQLLPGPSGCRQSAPGIQAHQRVQSSNGTGPRAGQGGSSSGHRSRTGTRCRGVGRWWSSAQSLPFGPEDAQCVFELCS